MTTIVLLHGLGAHGFTLKQLKKHLHNEFPHHYIITASTRTLFSSFDRIVERLYNQISKKINKTDDIILIGHSLGGLVARQLSVMFDTRVKGIISLGSPHTGAILADKLIEMFPLIKKLSPITSELTVKAQRLDHIREQVPHFHIIGNRKLNAVNPINFFTCWLLRDQINHDGVVQWSMDYIIKCRVDGIRIVDEDHISMIYSKNVFNTICDFIKQIGEYHEFKTPARQHSY